MDALLARHRGIQVAHSLNVIAELPRYADDTNLPVGLRVAAIDAFFVHARALIEFLIKPRDPRAIRRHDYAQNFHLDTALRNRLDAAYELASRHVLHFNAERAPTPIAPVFKPVGAVELCAQATDVFDAMEAFARHLAQAVSPHAKDFEAWLAEARRRQT